MKNARHPGGLYLLFTTEMAERFSYYGMRTILVLYLVSAFFGEAEASQWYGSYTGLVYLTPLLGGYLADKLLGNRRSIIIGGIIMAVGQFLMFASASTVHQSIFTEGGAVSNVLAGKLASLLPVPGKAPHSLFGFEIATLSDFFMVFAVLAVVTGVLLLLLCCILDRMAVAGEGSTDNVNV